jgi:MHS family proline/betaine transporter-like MFS transporter
MATDAALDTYKFYFTTTKKIKILFPTIIGTVVEYYDYALYGFCASLLADQFFPKENTTIALLKTFAIFLGGSLSKPLGALIFGSIGDKAGRSLALKISMVGIALPTAFIGLMPTYDQIGWLAPFLLLSFRMMQGIFTAGESDGARILIYETVGKLSPCFANSLTGLAWMLGIYLASLMSSWAMAQDVGYAWRIPFIVGSIMGILVFWSRYYLKESPAFIAYLKNKSTQQLSNNSLFVLFKANKRAILATILLCGACGGTYHFYLVFFGNYLNKTLHILPPEKIASAISEAMLIYTLCSPLAGLLADRFGREKLLKISLSGLVGIIFLNAIMLHQGIMPIWVLWLTASLLSFFQAPGFVILLEKFQMGERYRTVSFGHAIGSALFSGSTPIISFWLWHITQIEVIPLLYFLLLSLLGFLAIWLLKSCPNKD